MPILWFLIILLSFVLLFFFFLFSRIYFSCQFTYTQQKQVLIIGIYLYRLRLLKREIDVTNHEKMDVWEIWKDKSILEGIKYMQKELRTGFKKIRELNNFVLLILQKLCFHDFRWHTHLGTGDASTTGMVAGGIWVTKGMIVGFMTQQSNLLCRPNISVQPYFQCKYIQTNIDCIVSIKIGQAITVFIKTMRKNTIQKEPLIQ